MSDRRRRRPLAGEPGDLIVSRASTSRHNAAESARRRAEPSRAELSDAMLPSRRTQMDSLVQPLVAQYLAMGCQSGEKKPNESTTPDEKGKDDA